MARRTTSQSHSRQHGATAVELALVLGLLVSLVLGLIDLTRWTLAVQGLHEGARLGARLAAVCDLNDTAIAERVRARLTTLGGVAAGSPSAPTGPRPAGPTSPLKGVMPQVTLAYEPAGCTVSNCTAVRITLQGAALPSVSPWWPSPTSLPTAMVELPRESLRSTVNGRINALCL